MSKPTADDLQRWRSEPAGFDNRRCDPVPRGHESPERVRRRAEEITRLDPEADRFASLVERARGNRGRIDVTLPPPGGWTREGEGPDPREPRYSRPQAQYGPGGEPKTPNTWTSHRGTRGEERHAMGAHTPRGEAMNAREQGLEWELTFDPSADEGEDVTEPAAEEPIETRWDPRLGAIRVFAPERARGSHWWQPRDACDCPACGGWSRPDEVAILARTGRRFGHPAELRPLLARQLRTVRHDLRAEGHSRRIVRQVCREIRDVYVNAVGGEHVWRAARTAPVDTLRVNPTRQPTGKVSRWLRHAQGLCPACGERACLRHRPGLPDFATFCEGLGLAITVGRRPGVAGQAGPLHSTRLLAETTS